MGIFNLFERYREKKEERKVAKEIKKRTAKEEIKRVKSERIKTIQRVFGDNKNLDWDGIYLLLDKVQNLYPRRIDANTFFSEKFLNFIKNNKSLVEILENTYNKYGINRFIQGEVNDIGTMIKNLFFSYIKQHPEENKKFKTEPEKLRKELEKRKKELEKRKIKLEEDKIELEKKIKEQLAKNPNDPKITTRQKDLKELIQEIEEINSTINNLNNQISNPDSEGIENGINGVKTEREVAAIAMTTQASTYVGTQIGAALGTVVTGGRLTSNTRINQNNNTYKKDIIENNGFLEEILTNLKNYQSLEEYVEIFNSHSECESFFSQIKSKIKGLDNFSNSYIIAYYLYNTVKRFGGPGDVLQKYKINNKLIEQIFNYASIVDNSLYNNYYIDVKLNQKRSGSKEEMETFIKDIYNIIEKIKNIKVDNDEELFNKKEQILNFAKFINDDLGRDYVAEKLDLYINNEHIDRESKKGIAILYAHIMGINIESVADIEIFIQTVLGENTKYTTIYETFNNKIEERDDEWVFDHVVETLTARYEMGQKIIESRNNYGFDLINFVKTADDPQSQTGLQIANGIDDINKKLEHYKFKKSKSEINEHEDAALRYTAFETTFNNAFNFNDIIVQKLVNIKIDLRSELTNYGIYDKENNTFNKNARNKFINDRLLNTGLTPEEIETLGKTLEGLPSEVEKNYEILCGNFDADQDSIEKISKIYALGEIIDNIKTLFSGLNSKKLGNFMDLQLDEESPADIIGDCLFIKGKVNGTETNIKYDLRTGKVYMNSFTQQILNPPKIIIGNTAPNTEIGDFGSFEDAISNMDSMFVTQDEEAQNISESTGNYHGDLTEDEDKKAEQDPENLIKTKLNRDLKVIGEIVKDNVGEQTQENNIINCFLKTFGISSDTGESKEFTGGSKLYTILNNFININNESELIEISNNMKELMKLFTFSRGENNDNFVGNENYLNNPGNNDFNSSNIESLTIFSIDEEHATEEIKSLQIETRKFFPDGTGKGGEKEKFKGLAHFDNEVNISIINIIVDKCCPNGKLSKESLKNYIIHIKKELRNNLDESDKLYADELLEKELP